MTRLTLSHPGPRCAEVFNLAQSHGLPCDEGDPLKIDRVLAFVRDYSDWVPQRDAEVRAYLANTRSRYRLFLPEVPSVSDVAAKMYWYFDDLVMPDPLSRFLGHDPLVRGYRFGNEDSQLKLVNAHPRPTSAWADSVSSFLRDLRQLQRPMLDNIIAVVPRVPISDSAAVSKVVQEPEVRHALTPTYQFASRLEIRYGDVRGADGVPVQRGSAWKSFRVRDQYGNYTLTYQNSVMVPAGGTIDVNVPLDERSYHTVSTVNGIPPGFKNALDGTILREVSDLYALSANAQVDGGAVLCLRDIDTVMIRKLYSGTSNAHEDATHRNSWSYDLSLPHLRGLSPSQLFDLRHELPDAFETFRARLSQYCVGSRTLQQAHTKAEALTELETDLRASLESTLNSSRIVGYGTSLAGAAAIVLGALGMNFLSPIGPMLGAGGLLAATARSEKAKRQALASPAYFIWKAHGVAERGKLI